jgi:replicative DNA helicase
MTTSLSDAVQQTERTLLGSILLENSLWPQSEALRADDFSIDTHRRIYRRMASMFDDGRPVDIVTLTLELAQQKELAACGDSAYLASLLDHAFPPNFQSYVRQIGEAACERRYAVLCERLLDASANDTRRGILTEMQGLLSGKSGTDWRATSQICH